MKTKDLDKLTQGDIVVFIKPINGWAFNKLLILEEFQYKIGDQYKFHSFKIMSPMSSSTVYLESLQGEVIAFTPKVAYNIETLQKWRQLQLEKLV
jgi:hypothetical protein